MGIITGISGMRNAGSVCATLVVEQIEVLQQEMCYVSTWFNTVRFEGKGTQFLRDQEAPVTEEL